jgi:soluble lytic murein transglycosylase-like protein
MPPLGFDAALGVPKNRYGKLIYQTSIRYALNPLFMAAIMKAESDFNPRARSRKGALGLMQMLPSTARRFGLARRKDLFNPKKNIETAGRYLRWLVNRFGEDPLRVLAAYNAGEGAVERFGGVPPFAETRDYVQRIFADLGFVAMLVDAPAVATALSDTATPAAGTK